MKYMIHCCAKRLWYVEDFLVPSMVKQGIDRKDIVIWNDEEMKGNLRAWLSSCEYIRENLQEERGIWHLQDDVIIADNFREEAEKASDIIVNGWVCVRFNPKRYGMKGEVGVLYHWNSFQTIYIPNKYIEGFLRWYYKYAVKDEYCVKRIEENRWDDWLFWTYMRRMNRGDRCLNLAPNISDHIDYMLGGSIATPEREGNVCGVYWEDNAKIEELWKEIKAYRKAKEDPTPEPTVKRRKTAKKAPEGATPSKSPSTKNKPGKRQNNEGKEQ